MTLSQANAFCCGEGGNLEVFDPTQSQEVSRRRLAQAQATEAQVLVTACARNKRVLATTASQDDSALEVLDIVELVELATREEGV
jgi:Fe-S oxidoreductase